MFRRLFTLLLTCLTAFTAASFATAGPATAAPYPPSASPGLTASAYDPCAGASNVIGGNGFVPGETVRLVLAETGEIARVPVSADGTFQTTVTIPLQTRGSDKVTATGLTSGRSASLTLDVPCVVGQTRSDTAITSGGGLASTGAAIGGAVVLGVVLLGLGGVLLLSGRRRRGSGLAH